MHDLKDIRKDPDKYRESQRKRGQDPAVIDEILALDITIRAHKTAGETAQSKRNKLDAEYGRLVALQKKGETTYVDAEDGETRSIETGLLLVVMQQIVVSYDEIIAKNEAYIAHLDRLEEKWFAGNREALEALGDPDETKTETT